MSERGRRRALSLRWLLALLLGALAVLVVALLVVASLQVRSSQAQTRAENRRTASFLLADSMRQSSNDLTNMVRLYVATGEPRYRAYYDEILAIRAGTAPRPRNYDSSFWDRVLARGKAAVTYGPPESLTAQMRAAQFAPAESRALKASLDASNGLAEIERDVMTRVARRLRRGADAGYVADGQAEYLRLVDRRYLLHKGTIMRSIERFIALVERRTLRAVERARDRNRALAIVQIALLAAIALLGLAAMVVLSRVALRPLDTLIATTRRIARGDYSQRVDLRGVSELERVAAAFNDMAGAVESDVAARARAERDADAARQSAEHANRAKSTFLAAMSHEIRTPMIGVSGMLEVLRRTQLSAEQRAMVATAESSARSLLQIIGDILDFSKIEAEKLELAPTTLDVRALVGASVEPFVHSASAKGLLLSWSADEEVGPAHVGDPLRLRQILSNLLSNAVKFTEVGGIDVTLKVTEDAPGAQTVEFTVSDTGIGIDEEQQRSLFAEFSQADASTTRRFGGTGLGLIICKRLAVLMGGDVTMQSSPGAGTTVRLTVPLPRGDPADVEPLAAAAGGGQATVREKPTREEAEREGSVLLLAEDHPVNAAVLCHQFDLIGFHVDVAQDGVEAYERYRRGRYALVLTDLNMPGMDGFALARAIRDREAQTGAMRTPIIALTASVMQGEPEQCAAAGMDDFVAKPTTIPFLAGRLRHFLGHLSWREPAPVAGDDEAASTSAGLIDPAALAELTGGDDGVAAAVLDDFVSTTRIDLEALEAALSERQLDRARLQAHRIQGAARTVGIQRIAAAASQVENRAGAGWTDWTGYDALVVQVRDALGEVAAVIGLQADRNPG